MNDTVTTEEHKAPGTTGPARRKGRLRAIAALPIAAVLLLAGCGDDGDDDNDPPTASPTAPMATPTDGAQDAPPAPGASPADTATFNPDQQAAATAYATVLDPNTPTDRRVALIQDADKLQGLITAMIESPLLGQVSADVKDVKVEGDTAEVTFDILLNGQAGTLPTQTMPAVKDGDTWKVGAKTICTLAPYAQASPPPACADY